MTHVTPVSYTDVYIINPVIRSISGRHTITESDLGLPPGTLPPEDVASIGSLITVDKEVLRPFNSVRTATKRLCESKGVRVGMGTAVPGPELQATMAALEASPVAASLPVVLAPVAATATVLVVFVPSDLEPSGLVSPGFSSGLISSGGAMTVLLATASL